ncbi:MAG TPA: TylF/MycF/NovP-related O-methyltransferase [Candidatus Paceibacterota bacterium]|nr:TylF/MycF/NovP-related O-methyltransferase [Candidatus Paceibacterota bacterium]
MLRLLEKFCQRAANFVGYKIVKIEKSADPFRDPDFERLYEKCKKHTMTSKGKVYALYNAVKYILQAGIPGDFVECGVWRGGNTMLIAYMLLEMQDTSRKIYLYDTFEGMVEPTPNDYTFLNQIPAVLRWKREQKDAYNEWCFAPLEEVQEAMFSTGYPKDRMVFVKGKVEKTIPQTMPEQISLLRLDTDWYESSRHELAHLFPLLARKGVLILDDYRYWAGQKKATDEYFTETKTPMLLVDNIGGATVGVKIS